MKRWFCCLMLIFVTLPILPAARADDKTIEAIGKLWPLFIGNDQIGLFFADGLAKQYGLANNPEGLTRVQNIAHRLEAALKNSKTKYDFGILGADEFNAVSIYGGRIRVFQGLLNDLRNSDDELAAVLAHEIAHNELEHNKETVKTFKIAYGLELAKISEKAPTLLLAGANAVLAKRSRKFEKEADEQALKWMAEAGFRTTGAIAVFRRIEAEHNSKAKNADGSPLSNRFSKIFATHPEPKDRVAGAEDYLLMRKYGRTFREVKGSAASNIDCYYKDSCLIVAHPSLWESPLRVTGKVHGVGIFNPSPVSQESADVRFFLDICANDHLVAVTCDNDSHDLLEKIGIPDKATDTHFTFIEGDYAAPDKLIQAIKEGKTYASANGVELKEMNFPIGRGYPNVNHPKLTFKATLNNKTYGLDQVIVFRDGTKWQDKDVSSQSDILSRDGTYTIEDKNVGAGRHWYVIYSPMNFITSPITLTVTKNPNDPTGPGGSSHWQKGCIHYHSFYSDGGAKSIQDIWDSGRKYNVGFIFMTDHADKITSTGEHAYSRYADDCQRASSAMLPGLEYSLRKVKTPLGKGNHILILDPPKEWQEYQVMSDEEFFNGTVSAATPDKVLIEKGPFHLGDDQKGSEIHNDAVFDYGPQDAVLKLRVKGTPRKDPIIWINRQEVGRVVTEDDQWHWHEFLVPKSILRSGKNLFHIQSYIPDRWQTFDDCEVADVYILKK